MLKMLYKWLIEIALQAPVTQEGNFDHNKLFILAFTVRCERQVVLPTTIDHYLVVRQEFRLSAKR